MANLEKIINIKLAKLRMHSASSVQLPPNITDFRATQPYVKLRPLQLHSVSTFHIPSTSMNNCFHNSPRVVLSPLKNSIQRNNAFQTYLANKRRRVHPCIDKCNAKR